MIILQKETKEVDLGTLISMRDDDTLRMPSYFRPRQKDLPELFKFIQYALANEMDEEKIVLQENERDGEIHYQIIDGKKRLHALMLFLKNEGENLSPEDKLHLNHFSFPVTIVTK